MKRIPNQIAGCYEYIHITMSWSIDFLRLVKMNVKLFIGWKNLEVGNNVITGIKITFHRIHYHQPVPNNYGKWLRSSPFGKTFKHRCDIKNWEKSQASEFLLLSSRIFIWLSMWLWKENGNRMKCEFWGIEEMLSFLSKEWDNTSKAILHQVRVNRLRTFSDSNKVISSKTNYVNVDITNHMMLIK